MTRLANFVFMALAASTLSANAGDEMVSTLREPLADIAARYGFHPPQPNRNNVTFASDYTVLTFEAGSRKLLFNGLLIWMNDLAQVTGQGWSLARTDVAKIIDPLLRPDKALFASPAPVVMLDPGHGGIDNGAAGGRIIEKQATLDLAQRVQSRLAAAGLTVKLTREGDETISLAERTAKAQRENASLYVSIHMNSARNTGASGLETYVVTANGFPSTSGDKRTKVIDQGNRFDAANTLLAYYIHRSVLLQTGTSDRGMKRARFDVLSQSSCPAVLVECGFLSNELEESLFSITSYRDAVADGIAEGIFTYLGGCLESK